MLITFQYQLDTTRTWPMVLTPVSILYAAYSLRTAFSSSSERRNTRVALGLAPLYRPSTDELIAPRSWLIRSGLYAEVNEVGGVPAHTDVPADGIVLPRDFSNDERVAFRYLRELGVSGSCPDGQKKTAYDVVCLV